MNPKSQFHLEPGPAGTTRVVENVTNLIWRTLPTRSEAGAWITAAEAPTGRKA